MKYLKDSMHLGIESVKIRSEQTRTQEIHCDVRHRDTECLFVCKIFTSQYFSHSTANEIHNSTTTKKPIYYIAVDFTLTALIIQSG